MDLGSTPRRPSNKSRRSRSWIPSQMCLLARLEQSRENLPREQGSGGLPAVRSGIGRAASIEPSAAAELWRRAGAAIEKGAATIAVAAAVVVQLRAGDRRARPAGTATKRDPPATASPVRRETAVGAVRAYWNQVPATVAACAALRASGQVRASQARPPVGAERAALVVAAPAAARARRGATAAGQDAAASVVFRPAVVVELSARPWGADGPAVLAAGVRSTAATVR